MRKCAWENFFAQFFYVLYIWEYIYEYEQTESIYTHVCGPDPVCDAHMDHRTADHMPLSSPDT